jgi:hypothetical protein
MKKLTLLLSLVFATGVAFAADAPTTTEKSKPAAKAETTDAKAPATAKMTHHKVAAEVVSVDAAKNTITIKTDKGENTAPVEGAKAQAELKSLKAGEKVTVTCRDENGEHKAVTAIKVGTESAAKTKSSTKAEAPAAKSSTKTKSSTTTSEKPAESKTDAK